MERIVDRPPPERPRGAPGEVVTAALPLDGSDIDVLRLTSGSPCSASSCARWYRRTTC